MKNPTVQYAVLGGGMLVLLIVLYWQFSGSREPTPDELAAIALSDADEDTREQAAVRLAGHPDRPLVTLRRVFAEADSARVKGAAALGLGTLMDWQSMPQLIEAMEAEAPVLRRHAAAAVTQIMGRDFGFPPEGPDVQRKKALEVIKQNYPVYEKRYYHKHGLSPSLGEKERKS